MKKELLYLFILLIGINSLLTSCSDDDDDNGERKNEIVYPSNVTPIVGGSYIVNSEEGKVPNVEIYLAGTGLSFNNDKIDWDGKGIILKIVAHSSSTGIVPGTYTYSKEKAAGKFSQLEFGTYDSEKKQYGEPRVPFSQGTLEINKSGSNYEIVITSKCKDNKELKVYYLGSLIEDKVN